MTICKMYYHKVMSVLFDKVLNNTMKAIFHDLRFHKYRNGRKI